MRIFRHLIKNPWNCHTEMVEAEGNYLRSRASSEQYYPKTKGTREEINAMANDTELLAKLLPHLNIAGTIGRRNHQTAVQK